MLSTKTFLYRGRWIEDGNIAQGPLWENVDVDSFNAKPRDKQLNVDIFYLLIEARDITEIRRL